MPRLNLSQIEAPSTSSGIDWSPQQHDIFDAIEDTSRGSIEVTAVAGSGKTTTLVEGCKRMRGKVFFGAFNKKIADEIKVRVRGLWNINAGTMHAVGLKNWKNIAPNCQVNADKLQELSDDLHIPFALSSFSRFMVSMAKQGGLKHPVDALEWQQIADHHDAFDKLGEEYVMGQSDPFEHCNRLLQASISCAEDVIDFDDMIYMPLFYGGITREYDWVLVDEAQDTNRVRRLLVEAMLNPGGRVCVVGDPHQAIYGFTGADALAMERLKEAFQCESLPLTVTYRCPKRVVEHAHQWVSHIQAAPTAPEGIVRDVSADDFAKLGADSFTAADAILCRNTKPLIQLALSLIRRNIGCRVEGRDIGRSLISLVDRWKTARTLPTLRDKLDDYREREVKKLLSRGQRGKAAIVEDKVDSLHAVMDSLGSGGDIYRLKERINSLFGDTEPGQQPRLCTLSTIHKSKGREWDRVYLLGRRALQPSKWAKQDWELEQEDNLCYVAVTRAKRELVEVEYIA